MKRIMSLLVVCAFALTIFAGCSASNPTSDTNGNTNSNTNNNTTVNTKGNTSGNINNSGMVAQQGDWIYYTVYDDNGSKLYKIKTDGTEKTEIE